MCCVAEVEGSNVEGGKLGANQHDNCAYKRRKRVC